MYNIKCGTLHTYNKVLLVFKFVSECGCVPETYTKTIKFFTI